MKGNLRGTIGPQHWHRAALLAISYSTKTRAGAFPPRCAMSVCSAVAGDGAHMCPPQCPSVPGIVPFPHLPPHTPLRDFMTDVLRCF